MAARNTERAAEARQAHYNKTARDNPIPVGATVLEKRHNLGRHKIEDDWDATPYIVVARLDFNVYTVQLSDGFGPSKNVTRRELQLINTGPVTDEHLPKSVLSGTTAEAMVNTLAHQHAPPTFEDMGGQWQHLVLALDRFYRTVSKEHLSFV